MGMHLSRMKKLNAKAGPIKSKPIKTVPQIKAKPAKK